MQETIFSVSEFVALLNQTLEYAYPNVVIEGEVSEFRISKGKWLYFKLQDRDSSVSFFGTIYHMQFPLQDGMIVKVKGVPRLHNRYGFSVNVQTITPSGEGTIKKALELLKANLEKEGLFDPARKRLLPEYPTRIGLVTSGQAAAYHDFMKIVNERWGGVEIVHVDVQVQGEVAPKQIAEGIALLNAQPEELDIIVITRGGGSAEDLIAFSSEVVVRAIAASRTPTIVGVGHEVDTSLADLVADVRATTPTNAAQIVVPNRVEVLARLSSYERALVSSLQFAVSENKATIARLVSGLVASVKHPRQQLEQLELDMLRSMELQIRHINNVLVQYHRTLSAFDPKRLLARGYSLVTTAEGKVLTDSSGAKVGDKIMIELQKGKLETEVVDVKK